MRSIPYGKQNLSSDDVATVVRTLKSPYLTQGPAIGAFERSVSRWTGAKHCVAVANGTVALHLAYLAAGIRPGDEVLMPANTFAATANAALYIGARPVFVDIEPDHFNLDPKQLKKHLTKKTRAIVPVHFAGHPVDMNPIIRFAKKHKLIVIEDAAHALGARYRGRPIGSLNTAAATFSFHPVKSITTGEGGMIVTRDKELAERMKLLRTHGVTKDARGWNVMTALGYNYRITDIQAALGTSQMKRLNAFITARHRVVRLYRTHLKGIDQIVLPWEDRNVRSAWHLYVIRVTKPSWRDPLVTYLKGKGVGVNFHYPPVYWHPYYRKLGYGKVRLLNTETYGRSCITLPLHTLLTEKDVRYVASCIRSFFTERNR